MRTVLDICKLYGLYYIMYVFLLACIVGMPEISLANPKFEVPKDKVQTRIEIDSDSQNILQIDHSFECDIKLDKVDIVAAPHFSYREDKNVEVNLGNAYVRYPLGVFSFYGGQDTVALSCYYRKFGKGFFAGISQDRREGNSFSGSSDARLITLGMLIPQSNQNDKHNLRVTYTNVKDELTDRRYQILSVDNERKFKSGDKLTYTISNNDRGYNGERVAIYTTFKVSYEQLIRKGFTIRWNLGFNLTDNDGSLVNGSNWYPDISVKMHMDL